MLACKECGYECSAQNALGYHLRVHGLKYPDYVVKHEHNGVWPTCLTCKNQLPYKKGGFSRFCSKRCAFSGEHNPMHGLRGEQSPNFGKVRTEEHRKNHSAGAKKRWEVHGDMLRKMMKTKEYREANSKAQTDSNKNNPEQVQKRISSVHRFWSSDSETTRSARKAASDRAIDLLDQGKIGPQAPFKAQWMTNPFTGKEEYMHSSWETAFLEECIAKDEPVTKKHDFRIPYVTSDGTERVYIPDFKALETRTIIEVKGQITQDDVIKLNALVEWAQKNNYEVLLWQLDYWEILWSPHPAFRWKGPL